MSSSDSPPAPPAPPSDAAASPISGPATADAAAPQRPFAALAVVAVVVGASLTALYLVVKIVAPTISPDLGSDTSIAIANVLGVLGLLAIIPAVAVIVMGHLALRRRPDGTTPGRALAGLALGLGYIHVLMWGNRLVIAAIVASQTGGFGTFIADTFWWA